jgi:hypothetical protein
MKKFAQKRWHSATKPIKKNRMYIQKVSNVSAKISGHIARVSVVVSANCLYQSGAQ